MLMVNLFFISKSQFAYIWNFAWLLNIKTFGVKIKCLQFFDKLRRNKCNEMHFYEYFHTIILYQIQYPILNIASAVDQTIFEHKKYFHIVSLNSICISILIIELCFALISWENDTLQNIYLGPMSLF